MQVEHVLATTCVLAWTERCWDERDCKMYEAGVELHDGHEDHLASVQRPVSCVSFFLQQQELGMQWPR